MLYFELQTLSVIAEEYTHRCHPFITSHVVEDVLLVLSVLAVPLEGAAVAGVLVPVAVSNTHTVGKRAAAEFVPAAFRAGEAVVLLAFGMAREAGLRLGQEVLPDLFECHCHVRHPLVE